MMKKATPTSPPPRTSRLLLTVILSALFLSGSSALVPPTMNRRNMNTSPPQQSTTRIAPAATRSDTVAIGRQIEERIKKEPAPSSSSSPILPLSTWKRRLNTKQDKYSIHKFAGLGWWLSSTVIFSAGAMTGFTELPEALEPVTYLFLLSTFIQSVSSIPMAIKFRSNEPVAKRGFISSAITTTSLAFTGFWLSPFAQDNIHQPVAAVLIALLVTADALYSMTSFQDMKEVAAKIQLLNDKNDNDNDHKPVALAKQKLYTTLVSMAPVGLPMNVFLLYHMMGHFDHVRDYFLSVITLKGSTPELVYYASMVTSISVCVGNLAATLYHRKLISKHVENLATIGALVVTVLFNMRAAGSF